MVCLTRLMVCQLQMAVCLTLEMVCPTPMTVCTSDGATRAMMHDGARFRSGAISTRFMIGLGLRVSGFGFVSGETTPCVKSHRSSYTGLYPQIVGTSDGATRAMMQEGARFRSGAISTRVACDTCIVLVKNQNVLVFGFVFRVGVGFQVQGLDFGVTAKAACERGASVVPPTAAPVGGGLPCSKRSASVLGGDIYIYIYIERERER